ncbi:MAG: hypothetical protein M3285_13570, partial [Actinomycetota bacterium]|nr:hypothetical protein [Actinomycetota bacterium]
MTTNGRPKDGTLRGGRDRLRAWAAFWVVAALFVFGFVTAYINRHGEVPQVWGTASSPLTNQVFFLTMFVFPLVGIFIASRLPRNKIGWVLLAIGLGWGLISASESIMYNGVPIGSTSAPTWLSVWIAIGAGAWVPPILMMGVYLILLFPDGKVPSPRWRWLPWFAAIGGVVVMVSITFFPGSLSDAGYPKIQNPLGIEPLRPVLEIMQVSLGAVPFSFLASAVALVQRFRRSSGVQRLQLKWLSAAAGLVALISIVMILATVSTTPAEEAAPPWVSFLQQLALFSFVLIPIAAGIAILKYRLYDIDVVINKTIVFGALAAFITGIYVAIVVGIGTLLGSTDEPNLALSIAATAVVAIAFSPVKDKTQRLANRLVYGHRASPYEVMTNLARTVATVDKPQEVVAAVAHAAATGINASTRVTLDLDEARSHSATWPHDDESVAYDDSFAIAHRGQVLGTLEVKKPRNEPLTPKDKELIADLCAQAGLGLHNARLVLELQARLV